MKKIIFVFCVFDLLFTYGLEAQTMNPHFGDKFFEKSHYNY